MCDASILGVRREDEFARSRVSFYVLSGPSSLWPICMRFIAGEVFLPLIRSYSVLCVHIKENGRT